MRKELESITAAMDITQQLLETLSGRLKTNPQNQAYLSFRKNSLTLIETNIAEAEKYTDGLEVVNKGKKIYDLYAETPKYIIGS